MLRGQLSVTEASAELDDSHNPEASDAERYLHHAQQPTDASEAVVRPATTNLDRARRQHHDIGHGTYTRQRAKQDIVRRQPFSRSS